MTVTPPPPTTRVLATRAELRAARAAAPRPIGLVPTMGWLHAGHRSLMQRARTENATTIATIFVNPRQFNEAADYQQYPRNEARDLEICGEEGLDLVFAPPVEEVYPDGFDAPYELTVPVNSSGSVSGVELAYEQPLFDNFGFALNYTYADGSEKGGGPLVGTSKNTYNASAYYEDEHFNARVSYTYRSSFFSGLDRSTAFFQDNVGNLAASLGYKFDQHWSVSFDALNLNNPKLKYYTLSPNYGKQPYAFYVNGRQYYVNLRFKI